LKKSNPKPFHSTETHNSVIYLLFLPLEPAECFFALLLEPAEGVRGALLP